MSAFQFRWMSTTLGWARKASSIAVAQPRQCTPPSLNAERSTEGASAWCVELSIVFLLSTLKNLTDLMQPHVSRRTTRCLSERRAYAPCPGWASPLDEQHALDSVPPGQGRLAVVMVERAAPSSISLSRKAKFLDHRAPCL